MATVKPIKKGSTGKLRQVDAKTDLLGCMGIDFELLGTFLSEKIGGVVKFTCPDASQKATFLSSKELDFVEFFDGATQTTPNRRVRVDSVYTGIDLTSEVWKIYDPSDGTTVLRTITHTHTYTGGVYEKTTEVTT